MTDRRSRFATDRVAAEELRGAVEAPAFVTPEPYCVARFSAFLHAEPEGARDRELLFGDRFEVIDDRGPWRFGRAAKDGYCGWIAADALGPRFEPTHAVAVRHTHLYPDADFKAPPLMRLPFAASLAVETVEGRWARSGQGWVRATHLRPIDAPMRDPVAVAALFLGAPYLWAGNTGDGIDCSGLIQIACLACGAPCPGDSDQQARKVGTSLPDDAGFARGDMLFWKTHAAWVADPDTILHANAYAMSVNYEPLAPALERIVAQGDGAVIARRRL